MLEQKKATVFTITRRETNVQQNNMNRNTIFRFAVSDKNDLSDNLSPERLP